MRLQITVGKSLYQIEMDRSGDSYQVTVNGKPFQVKAIAGGFAIGGTTHAVKVTSREGEEVQAEVDGKLVDALILDVAKAAPRKGEEAAAARAPAPSMKAGQTSLLAPMPGKIVKVLVAVGQVVKVGDPLLVLEAMKMQNEIPAPMAAVVREIRAREGQSVLASDVLLVLEAA